MRPEHEENGMSLVKVQNKDHREVYVNTHRIDFIEDTGKGFWRVVVGGEGLDLYYDWIKEILRSLPSPSQKPPPTAGPNDGSPAESAFNPPRMFK
jgi:hypothetical protein